MHSFWTLTTVNLQRTSNHHSVNQVLVVLAGISVYLACSPSLSTEKHFKNLSAIINAFAKQADVKIKQQKATQTQKQLQEEKL